MILLQTHFKRLSRNLRSRPPILWFRGQRVGSLRDPDIGIERNALDSSSHSGTRGSRCRTLNSITKRTIVLALDLTNIGNDQMAGFFANYSLLLNLFRHAAEVFRGDANHLGDFPPLQRQSDLYQGLFFLLVH